MKELVKQLRHYYMLIGILTDKYHNDFIPSWIYFELVNECKSNISALKRKIYEYKNIDTNKPF